MHLSILSRFVSLKALLLFIHSLPFNVKIGQSVLLIIVVCESENIKFWFWGHNGFSEK